MALLDIHHCTIRFGGLTAVKDFSLRLAQGELVGLIGPNGAGKTTLFNLISGVYAPSEGDIRIDGKSVAGLSAWRINELGIARTFQNIRLFREISVLDNVRVAFHTQLRTSFLQVVLDAPAYEREEAWVENEAMALLRIFGLDAMRDERSSNLPYGEQRRLEIARALATRPKVLLLDEPAAGMNPQEKIELMSLIRWVREHFDLSVLVIEHDMGVVMGICERIIVLDYGNVIAEGTPDQIRRDPKVIAAYLGEEVPGLPPDAPDECQAEPTSAKRTGGGR
jgi:branched-chain amino acid transport system ATP-binding protein